MDNPFEVVDNRLTSLEHIVRELQVTLLKYIEKAEGDTPLTVQQASEFLKISVSTIYSLVSRRAIPYSKKGKRLYFSKKKLVMWIEEKPLLGNNILH